MNKFQRNIFKFQRKLYYRFHGHGRYKTHSQYVYDLYTQCLKPNRSLDLESNISAIETFIAKQVIKSDYEIVRNINDSPDTLKSWRKRVADHKGLSVETYRFGIIFYNEGFKKQAHILNM
ncbi:hypothetical protein LJC25_00925 [Bacteroidales bacterium OttesenSCG-928-K03]|nr:hypothetical protein [Bacteroidales bacterium OttesenSCG-928-K22]MDL2242274.1 hypothetical protein [Bacteroidales bacterium OttesenSCG-928-K03]